MNILAFDTALGQCRVTLKTKDKVITEVEENNSRQAEMLIPMIEKVLAKADLEYEDLNLIALTVGPGSFTGLRVGISVAKTISLVTKTPILPLSTLEVFAFETFKKNPALPGVTIVQDAYRGEVYIQNFINHRGIPEKADEPSLIQIEEIDNYRLDENIICGNASSKISMADSWPDEIINSESMAELAYVRYDHAVNLDEVKPLYIRKPDAKLPGAK